MPGDSASSATRPQTQDVPFRRHVQFRRPSVEDGQTLWRIARDSAVLDLNSSYAYLLWCRDFSATSVVATVDGAAAGFVTGYLRPAAPETVVVWQVAVDAEHRGHRLAGRMLDQLVANLAPAVSRLETTITPDNEASIRLFSSFAAAHGARVDREPVFDSTLFPDEHQTEVLFGIGPL